MFAAISQVFRFEYVYATLPGMTITFFLCAGAPMDAISVPVFEGLAIIALVLFGGLGINALIDREVDQKYATFKNRIPQALARIGVRRTWWIIAGLTLLALALGVHIAWQFQSWLPFWLVIVDIVLGYGYSLPPLRFKLRGVALHALSLILSTCVIPFGLSVYTYLGEIPLPLLAFITGFALVQYGLEFSNQALDYLEDRAEGLQTPAVRLGVLSSLRASLAVPLAGMLIAFAGLYWLMHERWQRVGTELPGTGLLLTWTLAVLFMLAGYFLPMRNTWRMYALSRARAPEACVPEFPMLCNYAAWQASSVAGVAAATAVFFLASSYVW